MKKILTAITAVIVLLTPDIYAQSEWPREITLDQGGKITVYQPQPESLKGNILVTREVVSVRTDKTKEPVFGVVWTETLLLTDKDTRISTMENLKVTQVKFPDVTDKNQIITLTNILESEIPTWKLEINLDQIIATLEQDQPEITDDYNTAAPEVIYRNEPTTLIIIDGEPKVQKDDQMNIDRVINTPFLIVNNPDDKKFYLYAGNFWYVSANLNNGWIVAKTLTKTMKSLDSEIRKKEKENKQEQSDNETAVPTVILVVTKPAELIQTKGEAAFSSVEGTGLLYVTNTENEIFKCVEDQQYYILLSGRWYKASVLKGPWSYVASDKLPGDFAKIPEGSDKDVVLPFVAGTDAAREAVMDTQIPQTAKVDRNSTECSVKYDGEPEFELIKGTGMQVAVNTSSTVLFSNNMYYAVENGVWFISDKPAGPWKVSTERPEEVDKIPPENQAYNTKYVYIYETTPEYVYVGYTPGYMGCYVYGPTVIYGTGYYYYPWYGPWYYPRPVTYGFGMHYNPWTGWGISYGYSYGYFRFTVGYPGYGGYWGCHGYHPPYYHRYPGGHYGRYPSHHTTNIYVNNSRTNNIYNNRRDVRTSDIKRGPTSGTRNPAASTRDNKSDRAGSVNRPSTSTADRSAAQNKNIPRDAVSPKPSTGASNNMYSDKSGNVYQKGSSGEWQQRSNGSWQSSPSNRQSAPTQIDRSSQMRDRGNMRTEQAATYNRPSGGGSNGQAGARTQGSGRRR